MACMGAKFGTTGFNWFDLVSKLFLFRRCGQSSTSIDANAALLVCFTKDWYPLAMD